MFRLSERIRAIVAVTELHASRSQQSRTNFQHEHWSPGEGRLLNRSVEMLATLYF
jgi:hypothetical protein